MMVFSPPQDETIKGGRGERDSKSIEPGPTSTSVIGSRGERAN